MTSYTIFSAKLIVGEFRGVYEPIVSQHYGGMCGVHRGYPSLRKPPPSGRPGSMPKRGHTVAREKFSPEKGTFFRSPLSKIFYPKTLRIFLGVPPFQERRVCEKFFTLIFGGIFTDSLTIYVQTHLLL